MAEESNSLPSRFAVFSTKDGKPSVVARFENDDVWLTQKHLAELFNTTKQNVNQHILAIYGSGELDRNRTVKKYLTVQTEGTRTAHVDERLGRGAGRSAQAASCEYPHRQGEGLTRGSHGEGGSGV